MYIILYIMIIISNNNLLNGLIKRRKYQHNEYLSLHITYDKTNYNNNINININSINIYYGLQIKRILKLET